MTGNRTTSVSKPIVTIDGPAGSGKSTTAKEVARRLGLRHLDSGALYRAITYALLRSGVPEESWATLGVEDLSRLDIEMEATETGFQLAVGGRVLEDELRAPAVTARVSHAAALPAVRSWLLSYQRSAGKAGGLVADGRDMGSVVFPDAELKVFLVADLHERARRRLMQEGGEVVDDADVEGEARRIEARDRKDSSRDLSPLRRPEGAIEMDTTRLSFDEQVAAIVARAEALTL